MALQYPGVSSITRMGVVVFGLATIPPPLSFKRAGRVCDLLCFVRAQARERLLGNPQSPEEISLESPPSICRDKNALRSEGESCFSRPKRVERPAVIAIGD